MKQWGCARFPRTLRARGDVLGDFVMIKLGGFIERACIVLWSDAVLVQRQKVA